MIVSRESSVVSSLRCLKYFLSLEETYTYVSSTGSYKVGCFQGIQGIRFIML